jgi:phosphodiesterase/alkaline phosphatase D-like protein
MRIQRLTRTGLATFVALVGGLLFGAPAVLAAAPAVGGEGPVFVAPFEARFEAGGANAGEESTTCEFQYGKALLSVDVEHEEPCEAATITGGEQGIYVTVRGLEAETAYNYRFVLNNTAGEDQGAEQTFMTGTPEKPGLESESSSAVESTTATLEAQINPDSQKTAYKFEYATNEALTGAKTISGAAELEGFGGRSGGVALTGLKAGETYYYRVVATNATGTSTDETVQSLATVPTPVTDAPENVTGTGATFKGHLTLGSTATSYSFDYNDNGECLNGSSTPSVAVLGGTPTVSESWEVPGAENPQAGLQPDSKYMVCFVLSNAYGSQAGPAVEFTTPPTPPTVDSESTSSVSETTAVLQAMINPNLQETTYLFEYSPGATLAGTITTVHGQNPLPAELKELPASVQITGLAANTLYSYRAVAENATPLSEDGPVQSFVTFPNTPVTEGSSAATTSTASVTGTIDPSSSGQLAGHETSYYFEYGNDLAYGKQTPVESAGEGPSPLVETTALTGLAPNGTYHYRIVARNESSEGSGVFQLSYGQDGTFTTPPTPPVAVTGEALEVKSTTATLTGDVNSQGLQATYELDYNLTGYAGCAPEAETGYRVLFNSNTVQGNGIAATISGLAPGSVYHYRTVVTTADGVSCGAVGTFTTQGSPLYTPPAVSIALLPNPTPPSASKPAAVKTKTKSLTRAQKLAKALKACRQKGAKRVACERAARKRYAPAKRGAKKKKG